MLAFPNHLKLLLLTLCFGTLCLLAIRYTPIKKHKYCHSFSSRRAQTRQVNYDEIANGIALDREANGRSASSGPGPMRDFANRRNRIKYLCTNMDNRRNSSLYRAMAKMVVDVKHNLTWCPVYKAASSVWMKNFAVLSGLSTTQKSHAAPDSHPDYNEIVKQKFQHVDGGDEQLKQMEKTVKFITVRHPFERLLSAYRDKLEHVQGREYYYRRYGQYITRRYRAKQSNLTNPEPSFTEFLQFVAREKHFDEHWVPFFDSCQPCSIDYDFVLKFESFSDESNRFIKENHLQYRLDYVGDHRERTSPRGPTNDLVAKNYFQRVPATLLSEIYNLYQLDFLLFSYSPVKYYYMATESANK